MDRSEAIIYLKELLSQCNDLSPDCILFETPNDSNSIDYRIHIKGTIPEADKHKVREVAKRRSLSVQENPDGVIVYQLK